jgi:hypothetical protein
LTLKYDNDLQDTDVGISQDTTSDYGEGIIMQNILTTHTVMKILSQTRLEL